MADLSHRGDLAHHPDASEMRARRDRVLGSGDVAFVDSPVFLIGLYCAVSPWIVHFSASQPALASHNLVIGGALAIMALGFTLSPMRMHGLSWAISAIGVWMVLSPWIVGTSPDAGVIWSNVIVGGVAFCLGLAAAATARRADPSNA